MLDQPSEAPEFSRWRSLLWPVHHYELKKLLPMLLIFFLVSFDYNILRTLKDTLVVTAKGSGAEVIPFIKVWGMFPGAILMTYLFSRLSNRLMLEKVVYVMLGGFLLYFLFFTFLLYPNREALHPTAAANFLESALPVSFKWWITMMRNWVVTSFYVMSELWSNIIFSLLIWGLANSITKLNEAKRFYALFGIGTNISGIAAGSAANYLTLKSYNTFLPFGTDAWEQSVTLILLMVVVVGFVMMGIIRWMHTTVLTDPRLLPDAPLEDPAEKLNKKKFSMREMISFLCHSRYLIALAVVVFSYNVVINLVEVLWKNEVRELYPNSADYNSYMNEVTRWIGFVATFSALFIAGNAIRFFGWTFTAMITPAVLFFTSVGFFFFLFAKDSSLPILGGMFESSSLAFVVFFGTVQNVLCRGAKYSVFDATKEMAFVPLSQDSKIKGKAAIDGICSRFGKSTGSLVHQSLLMAMSTLTASAPYVGGILFTLIGGWIVAVGRLGKRFNAMTTVPIKEQPVQQEGVSPNLVEQPVQ